MKQISLWLILILSIILTGCGENKGGTSFIPEPKRPRVDPIKNNNNLIRLEQNETDIIAYIRENTAEAFMVNGKDNTDITYLLSGNDFLLCEIDPIEGNISFYKPTDFEEKPLYIFNVILQDTVGHRTTIRITIHIVDTKDEEHIAVINSNSPLPDDGTDYFITTWEVTDTNENKLTIPTIGDGYNYRVDWGDGTSSKYVTTSIMHEYSQSGTYKIKIAGDFPRFKINAIQMIIDTQGKLTVTHNNYSNSTLKSIEHWGSIKWKSMRFAFANTHLSITATDQPDLSNVKDMTGMFLDLCLEPSINPRVSCGYADLNHWDVSKVENMSWMFYNADFEPDVIEWDVSNVIDMSNMFRSLGTWRYSGPSVLSDISKWNVSSVKNMSMMFADNDVFNGDITEWNVSNVIDMSEMFSSGSPRFRSTIFNQDIGNWDVSSVKNMHSMFFGAFAFNQNIGKWNVSNVSNMSNIFEHTTFNQNIGEWDVSNVTNMSGMFGSSRFNQNIGKWNVSNVTNMSGMFSGERPFYPSSFNQDIGNWDVSNVEGMTGMFFLNKSFNQDIGNWDVSNVERMAYMFAGDELDSNIFNQNIQGWNVSKVKEMRFMFNENTNFNQNLEKWKVKSDTNTSSMFENTPSLEKIPSWYN